MAPKQRKAVQKEEEASSEPATVVASEGSTTARPRLVRPRGVREPPSTGSLIRRGFLRAIIIMVVFYIYSYFQEMDGGSGGGLLDYFRGNTEDAAIKRFREKLCPPGTPEKDCQFMMSDAQIRDVLKHARNKK